MIVHIGQYDIDVQIPEDAIESSGTLEVDGKLEGVTLVTITKVYTIRPVKDYLLGSKSFMIETSNRSCDPEDYEIIHKEPKKQWTVEDAGTKEAPETGVSPGAILKEKPEAKSEGKSKSK